MRINQPSDQAYSNNFSFAHVITAPFHNSLKFLEIIYYRIKFVPAIFGNEIICRRLCRPKTCICFIEKGIFIKYDDPCKKYVSKIADE